MATTKSQRIGILIILIFTIVGTIGSFAVMILSTSNSQQDSKRYQAAFDKWQAGQSDYNKKLEAQNKELSDRYYPILQPYTSRPASFNKDDVKELKTEDLVIGEGAEVTEDLAFAAYYIGWNPDGKIFDQSVDNNALKQPLSIEGLKNGGVIDGWVEGIKGMKIGGVRELTIPSDKAYKETGKGTDIPPNTPLKFIVMVVEKPATIAQPEIPKELMRGY
jgi:FKBP-type peptidyl-prolyl cis-trans isomerase